MGKTRYKAIMEMLALIPDKKVHLESLKTYIRKYIATRDDVVIDVLKTMQQMGLMSETEKPFIYELIKPEKYVNGNLVKI